jgi:hypothetical protein
MADCHYCGKPAGFLRHQHAQCHRRYQDAVSNITQLFVGDNPSEGGISANQLYRKVCQDAAQNFISADECDDIVRRGFGSMIRAVLADGNLTEAQDKHIEELLRAFGVSLDQLGAHGTALIDARTKAHVLRALDAGQIGPVKIDGPFAPRLDAGEHALWAFKEARYLTMRSRTQYVGFSSGVSVRIMRGVYYRVGTFRGEPLRTEYLNTEDNGTLAIATQNVYFVGARKALKIPLIKVASAQLYTDGIEILQYGASAKPSIFLIDDAPFAATLLARLDALKAATSGGTISSKENRVRTSANTLADATKNAVAQPSITQSPAAKPTTGLAKDHAAGHIAIAFASESEMARDLALRRGNLWEFLLVEELSKSRLSAFKNQYHKFAITLASIPRKTCSRAVFIQWILDSLNTLATTTGNMERCINVDLLAAIPR